MVAPSALELMGTVPVTVYHQLWADCPFQLGQQALHLRGGQLVGLGYRQALQAACPCRAIACVEHIG